MQSNSEKQDFNRQQNNFNSVGVHSSYQTVPPLYAPYPQQGFSDTDKSTANRTPMQQQYGTILVPVHRNVFKQIVQIPVTTSLKVFLLLSGFLYSLWGIVAASIQLAIVINSYSTYYYGFWSGFLFIAVGSVMMIAGLKASTPLSRLTRMYIFTLLSCLIALVIMIVDFCQSTPCDSFGDLYCDDDLSTDLKIVVFSLAALHTSINICYVNRECNRAIKQSYPTILNS